VSTEEVSEVRSVEICGGIEYCMRFYTHRSDSGGLFVAVMQKDADFQTKARQSFLPLLPVSIGEAVFARDSGQRICLRGEMMERMLSSIWRPSCPDGHHC
jgi:hypothetical protein